RRLRRRRQQRLEIVCLLELVLRETHRDLVVAVGVAAQLQGFERDGDVLGADAQKAADPDHGGEDVAVLLHQQVVDASYRGVVGTADLGADEVPRGQPLILALLGNKAGLGGLGRGGGGTWRRCRSLRAGRRRRRLCERRRQQQKGGSAHH